MKFLGKDESVTLAGVQKSADDLRVTFDFFSTNVGKLQEKLQNDPHWLVETMSVSYTHLTLPTSDLV